MHGLPHRIRDFLRQQWIQYAFLAHSLQENLVRRIFQAVLVEKYVTIWPCRFPNNGILINYVPSRNILSHCLNIWFLFNDLRVWTPYPTIYTFKSQRKFFPFLLAPTSWEQSLCQTCICFLIFSLPTQSTWEIFLHNFSDLFCKPISASGRTCDSCLTCQGCGWWDIRISKIIANIYIYMFDIIRRQLLSSYVWISFRRGKSIWPRNKLKRSKKETLLNATSKW